MHPLECPFRRDRKKLCHWRKTNATDWMSALEWALFWFVFWQTRILPVNFFCWNYLLEVLFTYARNSALNHREIYSEWRYYIPIHNPIIEKHQTKTFKSPNTQKSIHNRLHCHPVVCPMANASHAPEKNPLSGRDVDVMLWCHARLWNIGREHFYSQSISFLSLHTAHKYSLCYNDAIQS